MNPFPLAGTPALSRSTATRDDELRKDPARLDALWAAGLVLLVDRAGRTPVRVPRPDPAERPGRSGHGQNGAGRDGTERNGTGRNGTGRNGNGRDGNGRDGTERDGAEHNGTGRDGTERDGPGEAAALSLGQSYPATAPATGPAPASGPGAATGPGSASGWGGEVALGLRSAREVAAERPGDAVLLGTVDGVGYWSVAVAEEMTGEAVPPPNSWGLWPGARSVAGEEWHDLRAVGGLLDDTAAGMFTTAVAVHGWHARARFCARCGAPAERVAAGWAMRCTGCGREEYPRTDPAVICLVHDGDGVNGQRVLLARQPVWPPERYSVLAGFVEAGESLEACVEREVAEEVGVAVRGIRYLGSQPWPFPRSVMIAFAAEADPAQPLRPADGEIEDARWVPREQVRAALAAGGEIPGLRLPGVTSIARQMLAGWAAQD